MGNPKRIIPVSEVKPGDSIMFQADHRVHFVIDVDHGASGLCITSTDSRDNDYSDVFADPSDTVTVGYTNRKAKRARGKMARRERLGVAPRPRFVGRENFRSLDVRLDWA